MIALLLSLCLAFAQEEPDGSDAAEPPPAEEPPEPPPSSLGLPVEEAIAIGDEMRANGAGYAALIAYTEALAADRDKAGERLDAMLYLSEHIGDELILARALRHYGVPEVEDKAKQGQAMHMAARAHVIRGEYDTALALVKKVPPGTQGHADAEALRGVILNQQGTPRAAIAAFLTAQGAGREVNMSLKFDDAMDLNLARTYYASKGYAKAIEFYANVDRESPWWPEATFERAWAHYMLNDMQGTLALLMNLNSPFFEDWYFPEADMLRGQAYFMMCKFPNATAELDAFEARYEPMKEELARALGKMDAPTAFAEVAAFEAGEPTKIPGPILRSFVYEERFQDSQRAVEHAQLEMSRIAVDVPGENGDLGLALLEERKTEVILEEGARVLAKARRARAELDERLQNLQISKLDIMQFEQRLYERAAVTGELESGDDIGELRKEAHRKGYRYWPYEGESWADELGNYRVRARPDCPKELAVDGQ